MHAPRYIIALLCLTLLLGCTQKAAEIKHYGGDFFGPGGKTSTQSAQKKQHALYRTITVQKGDTLYDLARRFSVPSKEIIIQNRLRAPYHLNAGQKLKISRGALYAVKRGDTLYEISRQHQVDMASLARINKLQAPYTLKTGQSLRLPSRSFALASAPPKKSATQVAKSVAPKAKPSKPKTRLVLAKGPDPYAPKPKAKPRKQNYAKAKTPNSFRHGDVKDFRWPVKGKVISRFGPKKGGIYNDGINISVPNGARIKASGDGVVVYAGTELKGYGNLLIVKHNNGWLSAYAHNQKILVRRGDVVKRGQAIALAGNSGNVEKPQLYFALRKGRKAVDPLKYLG